MLGAAMLISAPAMAQEAAAPAANQSSSNAERLAPEIAPPPPGMGQVVFYRPGGMGALVSCRVNEGDRVINRLPPGRYFVQQTTPGVHEYSVQSEAKDTLRVNVEDGETEYARCSIRMGFMVGRPNLSTQDRADFDKRGKKLQLQGPFEAKDDAKEEPKQGTTEAPKS
jgi:hypothetical protein